MSGIQIQQAITLTRTLVKSVDFDCDSFNYNCTSNLDFKLQTVVSFNEDSGKIFIVEFTAEFKNKTPNEKFNLKVKFLTIFQTKEIIDEEFKGSFFSQANAPAIAFPFLRSFITTLISNAGYSPIIISSINFAALYNPAKKIVAK